MALVKLWKESKGELEENHVKQIIAFTGSGKLRDDNITSREFRDFLLHVPSTFIFKYIEQCLEKTFEDSGLALQDIVNQAGKRLGFNVTDGRYRSSAGHVGYDGIWTLPDGHAIIVEVKTTDAYRIDLERIVGYRKSLINQKVVSEDASSILIIIGREDTGDLEAQIRGSRHAWDIRLISMDGFLRLMKLKEDVEKPEIAKRIFNILIPREFTKIDEIIDLLFSTAEDFKEVEEISLDEQVDKVKKEKGKPKFIPVDFNDACISKIQHHLKDTLIKRSRSSFSSAKEDVAVVCVVSKEYRNRGKKAYWFAFHPHQKEFLKRSLDSYLSFGCGSEKTLILVPFKIFEVWLKDFYITEREDKYYWHIHIYWSKGRLHLLRKKGNEPVDLTKYIIN